MFISKLDASTYMRLILVFIIRIALSHLRHVSIFYQKKKVRVLSNKVQFVPDTIIVNNSNLYQTDDSVLCMDIFQCYPLVML